MYTGCSCVPGGTAIKGKCEKSCPLQFFPYMAILCIVKFVTAMDLVPKMNVILRYVHFQIGYQPLFHKVWQSKMWPTEMESNRIR